MLWFIWNMFFPSSLMDTTSYTILERLFLWPLQIYESLAIIPVSFLRRHLPGLGGALVLFMALYGMLVRSFLEILHVIFAKITYSNDPVLNFHTFWTGMRDRYAFLELHQVDWPFVHQLFGEAIQSSTKEDDLWVALQESIALCDDASLSVSRPFPQEQPPREDRKTASNTRRNSKTQLLMEKEKNLHHNNTSNALFLGAIGAEGSSVGKLQIARGKRLTEGFQEAKKHFLELVERQHLTDFGRKVAKNFIFGVLNAETSPGWRIGYIALNSMEGFVELPIPRLDGLVSTVSSPRQDDQEASSSSCCPSPSSSISSSSSSGFETDDPKERLSYPSVIVPEIYDLESMRWALEAILQSLGDIDGLIFDLRFNQGGGSIVSSLAVASFFAGPTQSKVAFTTDEKLPDRSRRSSSLLRFPLWKKKKQDADDENIHRAKFSKPRKYYIPYTFKSRRYSGPLVILQSHYTRGTAELLTLALMTRPKTCRIGTNTAGNLSQTRKLRLPNYWTVEIPYQRCFSHDGKLYEGIGIPPEKQVHMGKSYLLSSSTRRCSSSDKLEDASPVEAKVDIQQRDGTNGEPSDESMIDPFIRKAVDHIMEVSSQK